MNRARTAGRRLRTIGTFALPLLLFAVSCGEPPPPPNVLLIIVDTLRADHLGCYGDPEVRSPMMDALAARGAQFRCFSQGPWTLPTTATIMTGLYPAGHGANFPRRTLSPEVPVLAESFLEAGYHTAGIVSHDLVGAAYGFNRGFEVYDDSNARGHNYVSGDSVTTMALDWLDGTTGPFFLFLHYFDPHYNYLEHAGWTPPLGDYDGEVKPGTGMTAMRKRIPFLGAKDVRYLRQLYRGEIAEVNGQMRRLFRYLEENSLDRNLAVVMTGDHGEEFLEHGWLGHTRNLGQVLLNVPLLVSKPGTVPRGVQPERAMQIDIRPTLLDLAGLPPPDTPGVALTHGAPAGRALYAEVTYDASAFINAGGYKARRAMGLGKKADRRSLVSWPWKIVEDRLAKKWVLYDLENDPGENKNLVTEEPEVLERMQALLVDTDAFTVGVVGEQINLSAEDVEKLRGLGYVN